MSQRVNLLNVEKIEYPLAYRPDEVDLDYAKDIFEKGVYLLNKDPSLSPPKIDQFQPEFIIDAGANIGYASIFFVNTYKSVKKCIAVEPAEDNFEILKYNAQHYHQIKCLNAAVWSNENQLELDDSYQSPYGYFVRESNVTPSLDKLTQAVTIEKLFSDSGFDYIDILKLDIEGSEAEIFSERSKYQRWLPYTKVVIIELHDRMNRNCSMNFFHAMSFYKYFFMFSGENLIFIREDLL